MIEKKIIKVLILCVVIMLSIFGLISLVESTTNYIKKIQIIDNDSLIVGDNEDYSSNINQNLPIQNLADTIDLFILDNNKNLSLLDAWEIKSYVRKYTNSTDDFNMMISLYAVESNFYPNANSFLGAKYGRGLGQVSEIALLEYNWRNKANIQPSELYDLETNIKISCWLINHFKTIYELDTIGTLMVYNKGINGYNENRNDIRYSMKILNKKVLLDNV